MNAMHVLSAAEMRATDRATTELHFIPSLDLMRNAAAAVAGFAREQFPLAQSVTVLCGTGNNGGDGMMAARLRPHPPPAGGGAGGAPPPRPL
jgi:NAD(P)H-hydrate epimerase